MNKKISTFLALALIISSCGNPAQKQEEDPIPPIGFRASDYILETTEVKRGETLPVLLRRLGLPADSAKVLISRLDTIFNPRKMMSGRKVEAYYSQDSLNRRLEYAVYNHSKTKVTVFKCADSLCLWNYFKPTTVEDRYVDVTINNSLWADITAEGAPGELALELSDIFAWTVNFFGLQKGDRFQTIYSQTLCEDEIIGINEIKFSRYTRGKTQINAIKVDIPGSKDKYFNEKGENLRKAFLKAPLKFSRISSKFTYSRKHPVTGVVRPHTGVDYAAPAGTPVHALGDGTVIECGWTNSGGGNMVKIKHNSVYTTSYMHLKGFAKGIKKGVKVNQGQVIGYVGSTGLSTGPHLDFRVWKNGQPMDPLKLNSPAADPLPKAYQGQLDSLYSHYSDIVNGN